MIELVHSQEATRAPELIHLATPIFHITLIQLTLVLGRMKCPINSLRYKESARAN